MARRGVGDPSGKDETRKILSIEDIERNKDGIKQVFSHFLRFGEGKSDAVMPDNAEWLTRLNWIEMLRDIGRHFSVNRMLAMDLGQAPPGTRSGDELHRVQLHDPAGLRLHRAQQALRLPAADGRLGPVGQHRQRHDLGRRLGTPQLHALTTPLITTSSGEKMGKTASGAVWLNADMKSPYEYWQFWRNTEDADVPRFLKLFTTLPLDEIEKLAALQGAEINEAKKALADAATTLLHGAEAARVAAETARQTFEEGAIAGNLPTVEIPRGELEAGAGVLAMFVKAGLVASNGEARRQIKGGGLRVNDVPVSDEKMMLDGSQLTPEGVIKLSLGKKRPRAAQARLASRIRSSQSFAANTGANFGSERTLEKL